MPKKGFPMPTAKNRFHILNLHPKKYVFKKIPYFLMPIYGTSKLPLSVAIDCT